MKSRDQRLMLELPPYACQVCANLALGLWERAPILLRRVGGILFALTVRLRFLSSYAAPPPGATGPGIQHSFAGRIGEGLQKVFAPIGFNWQISVALVPGLAARKGAVGARGTVYALSTPGDAVTKTLESMIPRNASPAAADGGLPLRAGLRGGLRHLPIDVVAGGWLMAQAKAPSGCSCELAATAPIKRTRGRRAGHKAQALKRCSVRPSWPAPRLRA